MIARPFQPKYGSAQSAAVSAAGAFTGLDPSCKQIVVTVIGTVPVYVRLTQANDTTNASIADYLVTPDMRNVLSVPGDGRNAPDAFTRLAYFATTAGSTVHVISGEGY